jgi:hypothetical protein
MKTVTFKEALSAGLSRYFTGRPCKYGHVAERQIPGRNCCECHNARSREDSPEARDRQQTANRKSYRNNRERRSVMRKEAYPRNRDSILQTGANYRAQNRDALRAHDRKRNRERNTGFTPELYKAVLEEQAGLCAICCDVLEPGPNTHADHCHATGQTRGVLCRWCNTGLGFFEDSPATLLLAIQYLNNHNKK